MDNNPAPKPEKRLLSVICRKCGHTLQGEFLTGINAPIRTICTGCKAIQEFPEIVEKARKREMAIGSKTAKLRKTKGARPR